MNVCSLNSREERLKEGGEGGGKEVEGDRAPQPGPFWQPAFQIMWRSNVSPCFLFNSVYVAFVVALAKISRSLYE